MKTFLSLVIAVFGFVVGAMGSQQQFKVPDSLPIGEAFPPVNTRIGVSIMFDDPSQSFNSFSVTVPYEKGMGKVEDAAKQLAKALIRDSVPYEGFENVDHYIYINIVHWVDEIEDWFSIGWYHGDYSFKPVQVNGKWVFPSDAVGKIVIGFQSDMAVYTPGLTEVEITVNRYSNIPEVSPNGITDVTCSEYPGGSAYIPDALMVPMSFAYSTYYSWHPDWTLPRGYYILRFGPDKSVWAKYDVETGKMLDTNKPKPVTPRIMIQLVDLASVKFVGLSSQQQKSAQGKGIKLSVVGSPGQSGVLEYSEDLKSWTKLTDVSLTYGSDEVVEPLSTGSARFYRVR